MSRVVVRFLEGKEMQILAVGNQPEPNKGTGKGMTVSATGSHPVLFPCCPG